MLVIPAIDIKDGCVVRLVQGRLRKKVYSHNPLEVARTWATEGARLIHIVDLDAAASGVPVNLEMIKEIIQDISVPVEVGGGIRKIETIKKLLDYGVDRVVLGTRAIEDEAFLKEAFARFKNKIIISLDAQSGYLLTAGWSRRRREIRAIDFAGKLKKMGFKEIIYTDTSKDGTLKGPDINGIKKLLRQARIKIIASGGISSLEDLGKLKLLEKEGLTGIIVGKALYEKKFSLSEALKLS